MRTGARFRRAQSVALIFVVSLPIQSWAGSSVQKQKTLPVAFNRPRQISLAPRINKPLKKLRIVSWNIDRGKQLPTIQAELARQSPDILLLQEVDWHTKRTGKADIAGQLARSLRLNMVYGIEFEELSQETGSEPAYIGQATLTRLPVRSARILRFETQSGFWKPRPWIPSSLPLMQRRVGGRIALITELQFQNRLLVVYNVHLESRSLGSLQRKQLQEVLSDMRRYSPETPIILGGDVNSKYFPSSYLKEMERQGFRSVTGERIERTHTIAMALDWIFVRGPLVIEKGEVKREIKGSDHYPIYSVIAAGPGD